MREAVFVRSDDAVFDHDVDEDVEEHLFTFGDVEVPECVEVFVVFPEVCSGFELVFVDFVG